MMQKVVFESRNGSAKDIVIPKVNGYLCRSEKVRGNKKRGNGPKWF